MTGTHGNVEMFATDQPTAPNVLFRSKFRELTSLMSQKTLWFSWLPLALICAAIASSLYWAQGTTPKSIEVIPWLIALFFVGMPHGAADLAVLQSKKSGAEALTAFFFYLLCMGVISITYVIAPGISLVGFIILSLWHFGNTETSSSVASQNLYERLATSCAKGGIVIGMPLAAWPDATASVSTELIGLTRPARAVFGLPLLDSQLFSPTQILLMGSSLLFFALCSWIIIFLHFFPYKQPKEKQQIQQSMNDFFQYSLIGILEFLVSPLFGIGIYFLIFHSWKQMPTLANHFLQPTAVTHPMRQVFVVHKAALPLLIPTWIILFLSWWALSSGLHFRDLALLSLLVYLIVTPAHEILCSWLSSQKKTT
jgi:Brp/Blh family beta-carotene 15,15'-monooxygenase